MASPIQALSEEVAAGFAGYRPESITDLRSMFDDLPSFFEEFAGGIRSLATRFDEELPVDPKVADAIREMGAIIVGLGEHCKEMKGLFETAHEAELSRLDNPRAGEEMWDVSKQE